MDPEEYLSKLNRQQRDAVEYCDGPQLVIAGAGSGKTRVLTYKIVHLLNLGYEPWRILALTFTNKAAREMRQRIEELTGPQVASKLWMGTFHSIFARILRANADRIGFKSSFTIYDSADSNQLVKMIIKDMDLDDKIYKPSTVRNTISWAKNALISPDAYLADRELQMMDSRSKRGLTGEIYRTYCTRCRVAGAMDFDDLLYYTYELFDRNPDVLAHYQEFFRYLLVDEYQDTNYVQHAIVEKLTSGARHLCVVGDDAQSIYSFRGADIRNILGMERKFPGLRIFKLERNYRSTQNIINAAGSLIAKNEGQIPKNVYSENSPGVPVEVSRCYSDYEEAAQVAARISQLKRLTGSGYGEFAVLYRTNAQSRVLEESLRKRNVPYRIYGGMSFYQRKEVKDAVAYFRLALNPDDEEALRRVINLPARGIGDTTMRKVTHAAIDAGVSLWQVINDPALYGCDLNAGTCRKLASFAAIVRKFNELNLSGADAYTMASTIVDEIGLIAMYMHDKTPEEIAKRENISELVKGAKDFVESALEQGSSQVSLGDFMAEVSLATDQDGNAGDDEEAVTLMTAHAAKGLEFDNVFIVGVEEELFPSAKGQDNADNVEEERRLLYVAITRARKFCMLSYAAQRFRNGMTVFPRPSRFIGDIDARYLHVVGNAGSDMAARREAPVRNLRASISGYNASLAASARRLDEVRKPFAPSPRPQPAPAPSRRLPADNGDPGLHAAGELSTGMSIRHPKFGTGVITAIDPAGDARITVRFADDSIESRTLMLKYAKFSIL